MYATDIEVSSALCFRTELKNKDSQISVLQSQLETSQRKLGRELR
jgi:hypothetical protein